LLNVLKNIIRNSTEKVDFFFPKVYNLYSRRENFLRKKMKLSTNNLIKSFCRGPGGRGWQPRPIKGGSLSSEFYPRPYALGPRLKLFKRAPWPPEALSNVAKKRRKNEKVNIDFIGFGIRTFQYSMGPGHTVSPAQSQGQGFSDYWLN